MGLDDRDYMRDRYRERQGGKRDVPLGSASWIGRAAQPAGSGGGWFEKKSRGHDYQRGRWRPGRKGRDPIARMLLSVLLGAILVCVGIGGRLWVAERMSALLVGRSGMSFPASGSVVVPSTLDVRTVKSSLTLQGSRENSVVQLIDTETMRPTMSAYIRAFERVSVPAPVGVYRVRFIHGERWVDARTFFGPGTAHDEVIGMMSFTRRLGHVLDLRLGPDSGLAVRRLSLKPESLQ